MKINFYAFYQENNGIKERINLLSLFEKNIINPQEHELDCNTYHLYLHKIDESTYLFTKKSDSELIKKINTSTFSVANIRDSLASDESLGFPSFVFINGNIMGFASSMYGPKIRELKHYIMQKELNGTSLQIESLMQNVTTEDALTMQFIG
ncbi:hypothetical protein HGO23_19300 [Xenorhabdus budapestensis]|uniref:Uncharacterized protein n=1 Tax=Xenorhabdus budapestensis TaxID=290110 RepID=A0ABX7VHA5_XENBU|nr:hypothetical protein [Xenorhabdus budapestensis]QTL39855.1 hypothetical protein HGO23_19300 [Xenorhabdus budapestensis]